MKASFAVFVTICSIMYVASMTMSFPKLPDQFLDPCKATGYMGDIALSENEFGIAKKAAIKFAATRNENSSLFEAQQDSEHLNKRNIAGHNIENVQYKEQSLIVKRFFQHVLKEKLNVLNRMCALQSDKRCRKEKAALRDEILKMRTKRLQLNSYNRRFSHDNSEVGRINRHFLCADKQTTECNNDTRTDYIKRGRKKRLSTLRTSEKLRGKSEIGGSRRKRAATGLEDRLWEFGVIPFVIENNLYSADTKANFHLAMEAWENETCLTFKNREPDDKHFIIFSKQPCGCCSPVGRAGTGGQVISIGNKCQFLGIIIHELGHVIGFWHEHTRPDRDDYVTIMHDNVLQSEKTNFNIQSNINSLNETYDYESIMHYGRYDFQAIYGLETIVAKKQPGSLITPQIGKKKWPSIGDNRQVNKMYKCPQCGHTMHNSSLSFGHFSKQGKPELCQWRITRAHGEKIHLNITHLDLPRSINCDNDYLEIRNGHYFKSPLLGRFCGDQVPEMLVSSGNRLWVEYKTSGGYGHGFDAVYVSECGGEIISEGGFLTSPSYPHEYPNGKTCEWKIVVPVNFSVAISFEFIDVEYDPKCQFDYVEIRDGADDTAPLIDTYCGTLDPLKIVSTGRYLYVKFVSDFEIYRKGFSATFVKEVDECMSEDHGCEQSCVNTYGSYYCECKLNYQLHSDERRCEPACGGIFLETEGTITSPSFPDFYPPGRKCIWSINAPEGHRIQLNFTHFDIEEKSQDCSYDFVQVSAGDILLGSFCGYLFPAPIISPENVLRIEFVSDKSVQKTGFSAVFAIDKDECEDENGGCEQICQNNIGGYVCECEEGYTLRNDNHGCKKGGCDFQIRSPDELIYSPNFPENYPSRLNCFWHISTASGHRIKLRFIDFDVEYHVDCMYDNVIVFDGNDISAPLMGKFCGPPNSKPSPILSSRNTMLVVFSSDASVSRQGFHAIYDVICGATFVATLPPHEFVSHPNIGMKNYDNRADCEWLISAPEGQRLRVTFSEFEVENSDNCQYDVVSVYDGSADTDHLIGNFCGHDIPEPIISTTEHLLIRFHADDTIGKKGFSVTYRIDSPHTEYEIVNISELDKK